MHETDPNPTLPSSEPAEGLAASALRAHAWYGEPFLHAGEDPVAALAPGTARRAALDDAIAEMDAGRKTPSNRWRVRYGLMLGLERVLASPNPATASGTDLRRHQIDALAGMLTELIASSQRQTEEQIYDEILTALADEARHILDEGVVASAAEIDACLILGAGFPFFRGGLTPYLDAEGVSTRVSGRPLGER